MQNSFAESGVQIRAFHIYLQDS